MVERLLRSGFDGIRRKVDSDPGFVTPVLYRRGNSRHKALGTIGGVVKKCMLVALVLIAPASATAGEKISWFKGNHITVQASAEGAKDSTRYELWVSGPGDVRVEESDSTGKKSGSILLVGGRFLAMRGIDSEPGMEIDTMDLPALNWQLAAQLLERAFPGGPPASLPSKEIAVAEPKQGIEVGTMSAGGEYGAPWKLKAKASRGDAGRISYQLNFSYTDSETGKSAPPVVLSGTWEHLPSNQETPASTSLEGWKIFSLGPTQQQEGSSHILDYGTSSVKDRAQTVGDLKKLAEKQP